MSNRYRSSMIPFSFNFQNISDQSLTNKSASFWINGVSTLILVIFGLCGNLLMIVSLGCNTKRWLPLYYYFMTFAVWNSTLLLATLVFYCLSALRREDSRPYENPMNAYLNSIGYPLANSGMTASVWLVLCLTVERSYMVSRPLARLVSQTKWRAKIVALAISVLAPAYSIPLFFELRICEYISIDQNSTVHRTYDVVKTGLRDDLTYKIAYRIVCNLIFLSLVPFVIVVTLSARIVWAIRNRADRKDESWPNSSPRLNGRTDWDLRFRMEKFRARCHSRSNLDHQAQRTHFTLTVLASKYVICYTLPTLLNILELLLEPKSLSEVGLSLLVDLSDLMVIVDSALNAFVYFSWRRQIQSRGLSFRSRTKKAARRNFNSASSSGCGEKRKILHTRA